MERFDIDGKVVVVTGASRGIGADTAKALAGQGARVVCAARTLSEGDHVLEGSLERTVAAITDAGGTATAVAVSLDKDEGCHELVRAAHEAYGRVDVLVNNAAVAFFGPTMDLKPSRWVLSWRVTCHAPFLLSQLVLPEMIERGEGRIVNITSESAVGPGSGPYDAAAPIVGDTAYGAQKAMIERMTQGLAQEMQPHGIGISAVAPSMIVPTPGAMFNSHVSGEDDPRVEPSSYMAEAIRLLITEPLEEVTGRVVYSQELLLEHGVISAGAGLGADPARTTSGFNRM
jgi:NAD(P)-dependent dehydrogenase (short-subunit alcohol dehydrogenase family)